MAIVEIEKSVVEYLVDGSGPGLVLVHGTGGSAEANWGHLVDRFARHWTVIRPNYSGSGNTTDAGGSFSVEQLAGQVLAAAKAAGKVPFDLVGFSLGAAVAVVVAARAPDLVRSLVLIAGFADSTDSYLKLEFSLWRELIVQNRPALARLFLLTGVSHGFLANLSEAEIEASASSIVAETNWDGLARQVELDLTLDVRDHVRSITRPTLVIGCTHDCIVPVRHPQLLAATIPEAEYTELATGHLAALEQPEAFATAIETFLMRN
ncbi:pimeloyl-ACP methyl ester carboxylesterase [Silvibacterium bohemicum]|uniref:Pimeloyl-ACP methyl ester carboxylesterase n=1 Tax=Silvibacterium bohemicum TaxID=1577686 RepID=A0A841JZ79_9BACT|nr:alpha/beta hydrolase [Silvibacterium bohemicum]MBB6146783.1 pimeloyl-ACP methyl ester carboxylesterase [Silvibacterium bohemicum]